MIVSLPVKRLLPGADGRIRLVDTACRGERHAQGHFGNGPRKHRPGGEHRDAAAMTFEVVDVGQKIALNIEDRLQFWRAIKTFFRQRRLADKRHGFGQITVNVLRRGGRAIVPDDLAK